MRHFSHNQSTISLVIKDEKDLVHPITLKYHSTHIEKTNTHQLFTRIKNIVSSVREKPKFTESHTVEVSLHN